MSPTGQNRQTNHRLLGGTALCVAFFALCASIIGWGRVGTGESADQINYHVPVVRAFAAGFPTPDVSKYDSATTPGYHYVMAGLWRLTGAHARWSEQPVAPVGPGPTAEFPAVSLTDEQAARWRDFLRDLMPLQLLNALLSTGLLMVAYFIASRFAPWWAALALCLPLALNQYVLGASIWLTTDNAGWFLALGALATALVLSCGCGAMKCGVWAGAAVMVRQVHLWVCGPVLAAGLLAWLVGRREQRGRTLAATLLAVLVPTLIVGAFAWLWGGLTPPSPRIREVHGTGSTGANLAAIPFALALFGAYGLFAVPAWRDQAGGLLRRPRAPLLLGLIALLSAVVVATTTQQPTLTDPPMRGYGWLWRLNALAPALSGRSLLLAVAAPVGAAVLIMLGRAAAANGRGRESLILLVGVGCWLAAQCVNPAAWQRYFDPMVLVSVAWLAALAAPPRRARGLALGALALALCMAALSARSIGRDLRANELPFDGGVLKMQGRL